MSVDIRRQQKTICPREPVQMAIFADVVLDGDKSAEAARDVAGPQGVNKNDKLDFVDFAFHSEQGKFDRDGWFAPNPNVLATAGKEFEIKSVFSRRPDKFSLHDDATSPTTRASRKVAAAAGPGARQLRAARARRARSGAERLVASAGGEGGDGGSGTSGGSGGDGATGPHLTVYATVVKTAFYERLVAIAIDGDQKDFLLVPEGQPDHHPRGRRRRRRRRPRRPRRLGRQRRLGQSRRTWRQGRSGRQRRQRRQRRPGRLDRIRV